MKLQSPHIQRVRSRTPHHTPSKPTLETPGLLVKVLQNRTHVHTLTKQCSYTMPPVQVHSHEHSNAPHTRRDTRSLDFIDRDFRIGLSLRGLRRRCPRTKHHDPKRSHLLEQGMLVGKIVVYEFDLLRSSSTIDRRTSTTSTTWLITRTLAKPRSGGISKPGLGALNSISIHCPRLISDSSLISISRPTHLTPSDRPNLFPT